MRKTVILWMFIVSFCLFALIVGKIYAQEVFPKNPLTLLVPWPPGGVSDTSARVYTPAVSKILGQPVMVLNKPGAGGTLAIDFLTTQKPDGYTLLDAGSSTIAYGIHTLGVNWGPRDFTMILGYSYYTYALVVRSDAPWKNFDEWVQFARQNPGFKYGSPGALNTGHILMEWIGKRLNLNLTPVQFKGDADEITNLLGGHISLIWVAGGHSPHVQAGRLRTLLQVTGEPVDSNPKSVDRLKDVLPDAPMGIVSLPVGIFGPKGIPDPIRAKLNEAFKKATVENPDFINTAQQLLKLKVEYQGPKELQESLVEASRDFEKLMKSLGLKRQ